MKILHTSDWHLGAKTDRRNRLEEQTRVMSEIVAIADEKDVDIVIISGDIYDNAVPTSDAEELFINTIEKLSANNNRVVIALAGNHDDPKRLTANRHFAKKHNIVLSGDFKIDLDDSGAVKNRIDEVGEGYVIISKGDGKQQERCVVGILPYPVDYRLNYKTEAESYSEKVKEWSKLVCKGFKRNAFNILATHLTLVGSDTEEDCEFRTVKISEAGVVKKGDLPKADYYALGHIHSKQDITNSMCYCGAPLKYSYIQRSASVNLVTSTADGKLESVEQIDLKTPARMERVVANGIEEVSSKLDYFSNEDIVELTIVQDKPLSSMQIKELKENFPCILQVKLKLTNLEVDENVYISNRDKLSAKDLFVNFYKAKKCTEPQNELTDLFVELMEDKTSETN